MKKKYATPQVRDLQILRPKLGDPSIAALLICQTRMKISHLRFGIST